MLSAIRLKEIWKIFNNKKEQQLINCFKALGDINRHHIFELLREEPKMSTSDIAEILKISLPLASQHLKILEQVNLIKKERVGQQKIYQINLKNSFVKILVSNSLEEK